MTRLVTVTRDRWARDRKFDMKFVLVKLLVSLTLLIQHIITRRKSSVHTLQFINYPFQLNSSGTSLSQ
jgi:hypothetical protein